MMLTKIENETVDQLPKERTGTPPDLKGAIMDGLLAATRKATMNPEQRARFDSLPPAAKILAASELQCEQLRIIEARILDRLRQDFGVAYMEMEHFDSPSSQGGPMQVLEKLARKIGVVRS